MEAWYPASATVVLMCSTVCGGGAVVGNASAVVHQRSDTMTCAALPAGGETISGCPLVDCTPMKNDRERSLSKAGSRAVCARCTEESTYAVCTPPTLSTSISSTATANPLRSET